MSRSSIAELLKIYLDGNRNEDQEFNTAQHKLLEMGSTVIPQLITALRDQLREYRSYTKSNAELREYWHQMREMMRDGIDPSSQSIYDEMMAERMRELDSDNGGPGISPGQRLVSSMSINRASHIVEKLLPASESAICTFLNVSDVSLILAASIILFNLENPSPYIVKSIVASRHLYIDLPYLSPPLRIVFYLLMGTIVHTGDEYARSLLQEDLTHNNTGWDEFHHSMNDTAIYFISVS